MSEEKIPNRKNRASMKQYSAWAPFERIALDIMGPLPESQRGNRYILVINDNFTGRVEALFGLSNLEVPKDKC